MNLVWIIGPASIVREIGSVAGLLIEPESRQPDGDSWRVSAYATDDAIAEIRARGAEVAVIMNSQRLEEQFQGVLSRVDRGEG